MRGKLQYAHRPVDGDDVFRLANFVRTNSLVGAQAEDVGSFCRFSNHSVEACEKSAGLLLIAGLRLLQDSLVC
jgi:hypothetical protein